MKIYFLLILQSLFVPTSVHADVGQKAIFDCRIGKVQDCIDAYKSLKDESLLKYGAGNISRACESKGEYCDYAAKLCDVDEGQSCAAVAYSVRNNPDKFRPLAQKACKLKISSMCFELGRLELGISGKDGARNYFKQACELNDGYGCAALIHPGRYTLTTKGDSEIDPKGKAVAETQCKSNSASRACQALSRIEVSKNPASTEPEYVEVRARERTPEDHLKVCKAGGCCQIHARGLTIQTRGNTFEFGKTKAASVAEVLDAAWNAKGLRRTQGRSETNGPNSISISSERSNIAFIDLSRELPKSDLPRIAQRAWKICSRASQLVTFAE